MNIDTRTMALVLQRLDEAERTIQYVRQTLQDHEEMGDARLDAEGSIELSDTERKRQDATESGERILEGVFDGQNMQGNDGVEYPIPPNYASKSKLVEGDILKLQIGTDGSFRYKQIGPVDRIREVGTLVVNEEGDFKIKTPKKVYSVLLASVTFYKINEGDEVTILLPENGEAEWGAVEHVMHGWWPMSWIALFPPRYHKTIRQFSKFVVTGCVGAIIDFSIFNALTRGLGWTTVYYVAGYEIIAANVISVFIAIVSNFLFNRYWTFQAHQPQEYQEQPSVSTGSLRQQWRRYFLLNLTTFVINQIVTSFFAFRVPLTATIFGDHRDNAAKGLAIGVVLFINFLGSKFLVFRTHPLLRAKES